MSHHPPVRKNAGLRKILFPPACLLAIALFVAGCACAGGRGAPPAPAIAADCGALRAQLELESDRLRVERLRTEKLRREVEARARRARAAEQWRVVRELTDEVAQLRGLKPLHPVEMRSLSKEETHVLVRQLIERDLPAERALAQSRALTLFGALEPGQNLRELAIGLYSEQVAGLYDEKTNQLYVTELFDPASRVGKVILAHEICHALQDQHFDFDQSPIQNRANDDRAMAALSVIEGDATQLMLDYITRNVSFAWLMELPGLMSLEQKQFNAAPPYMQYSLLFPYLEGLRMVLLGELEFPGARDRLLRQPPRSTEQVLHPIKYFSRAPDEPATVTLPDLAAALGAEWRAREENTLGEAGIGAVLHPRESPFRLSYFGGMDPVAIEPEIIEAAAGWGGDRWGLWTLEEPGAQTDAASQPALLLWRTQWDSPRDAEEFYAYAREKWLPRIFAGAGIENADGNSVSFRRPGAWARLKRAEPDGVALWMGEGVEEELSGGPGRGW